MQIRILGCSGGIGGLQQRTTALLLDDDILIDCGTGVGDLSLEALQAIDHVFLTHAHLDHVALLPMLVDSVANIRCYPITVYALPETLSALQEHVFNWAIWPDFTALPSPDRPLLRFQTVYPGQHLVLGKRNIRVLPATHSVPAVGYCLAEYSGGLAFSGDTAMSAELIAALNALPDLDYLLIETTFPELMCATAHASSHLCPSSLGEFLAALQIDPEIYVSHLKPSHEETLSHEIAALQSARPPRILQQGQVFIV